ncbi:MAG: serine--tRNA ligase [Candidatus Bathyarchaeota archaeon]|jgi:seryl-tRNA synthetase
MLDIQLIRENTEFVKNNLKKRGNHENLRILEKLIKHDRKWRQFLTELNGKRHQRKQITSKIAELRKDNKKATIEISKARAIEAEITILSKQFKKEEEVRRHYHRQIPNLLHDSVPIGTDENENVTVKTWGKTAEFNFSIKDHIDLASKLHIVDLERASKVAGARFFYLVNEGVLLDIALMQFALEEMINKGFKPLEPPFLMKREPYEGVVSLDNFEKDLYKVQDEDLYLIATSEHPIAAMHMNEVLLVQDLPVKIAGVSSNFRREAGAHGKDTRGIFRTHQFNKVEQFIFCHPEDSWTLHEELIRNSEELLQKLSIPYRVVNVCTGDIGSFAAKRYDIEAWMPAQNAYREIVSCSNCTDYQARRLNIKYRMKEGAPPEGFLHTLNSTALATGRTIVAILENYQQEDGTVIVPRVLRKFMGGIEKIKSEDGKGFNSKL